MWRRRIGIRFALSGKMRVLFSWVFFELPSLRRQAGIYTHNKHILGIDDLMTPVMCVNVSAIRFKAMIILSNKRDFFPPFDFEKRDEANW